MQIAIISGKGGTGKSSISAAFATMEEQLVLVDCDVDAANLYLLFDPSHEEIEEFIGSEHAVIDYSKCTNCEICIQFCRFDAIHLSERIVSISEVACDGCRLCSRICPVGAISNEPQKESRLYSGIFRNGKMVYGILAPGEENSGKLVNAVREKAFEVARLHQIETILIDGPPGIGCSVISTIVGVDMALIVTEPTLSGFQDLERIKAVLDHFQIPSLVLINKYDINKNISKEIESWCTRSGSLYIGKIPFNVDFVKAMTEKKSIIEYKPEGTTSSELRRIYRKIKKNYNTQK